VLEEVDVWGTKYSQLWGFPHHAPSVGNGGTGRKAELSEVN
jgi:hypothetical protein